MSLIAIPETVELISPETLQVVGVLTDGQTFKQPFSVLFSGPTTSEQARARLAGLVMSRESHDLLRKVLQVGQPFDLTPPIIVPDPPPDPVPPTQEALDRQAFSMAYRTYRQFVAALGLGLVAQDVVDGALAILKKTYQPGFEDLLIGI